MDGPSTDHEGINVMGFEVPGSPDWSYNNPMPTAEDFSREPPQLPLHLHQTVLNSPNVGDSWNNYLLPQNVTLNHLYIENMDLLPRNVVALGITHRYREKYVTLVLYKPVPRRQT